MSCTVYRVQDKDGRGPWKPGFSHVWSDDAGPPPPPPWWEEFKEVGPLIDLAYEAGMHIGSGCRTKAGLRRWFSRSEGRRLKRHGYRTVELQVDEIIGESPNQILFARLKPLREG